MFALVFTVMATFVVAITVAAARPPRDVLAAGSTAAASWRRVTAGATQARPTSAELNALLAAALRPILRSRHGQVAVGVIDKTTGRPVLYHANRRFHSARIASADMLAALLYQHQQAGTTMTGRESDLAAEMMANGSDAAATSLWRDIGGGRGLASANRGLKLLHTIPGAGGSWALTWTTVTDQLQLLTDLTSRRSPLAEPARAYELGLMAAPAADQHWGAFAAASGRTGIATKGGSLADPRLWVVNSIGVVARDGQVLLIAVLSSDNASQAAGISLASAVAAAAAEVVTRTGS